MTLDQLRRGAFIGDPDDITRRIEALIEAGANYINFYIPRIAYELEPFQLLTERALTRFV